MDLDQEIAALADAYAALAKLDPDALERAFTWLTERFAAEARQRSEEQ